MATEHHVDIDRARIKELTERESAKLDARTPGLAGSSTRAPGRASSAASPRRTSRATRGRSTSRTGRARRSGTSTATSTSTSTTASARWCRATRTT